MITFLKKYTNDSFEKLVNEIHWMDLPFRLKAIFSKLPSSGGDSRPYKVYTALLNQTGTAAPVATVLENTLGEDVVWTYNSEGNYSTTISYQTIPVSFLTNNNINIIAFCINEFSTVSVLTTYSINFPDENADGQLIDTPIEIRVYN